MENEYLTTRGALQALLDDKKIASYRFSEIKYLRLVKGIGLCDNYGTLRSLNVLDDFEGSFTLYDEDEDEDKYLSPREVFQALGRGDKITTEVADFKYLYLDEKGGLVDNEDCERVYILLRREIFKFTLYEEGEKK